uniref:VWFC domain-containing protein n=1 Tax=Mola mola TaxID=94237 RepID=A0A3Q4B0N2_MOLML
GYCSNNLIVSCQILQLYINVSLFTTHLQLPHQTACLNNGPIDTQSVSTTQLTAVNRVATWTHSSNHCSNCICEVRCATPECPKLPCMHQLTNPGACCPRCRGCVYGGEEHSEGSSWFADSTPCMTCMCVDGVTTCSEVRCLSPCVNFISVPGECCPVCAGKQTLDALCIFFLGVKWEVDECTSCTCVSGDVHCRSERCPPLTCATVRIRNTHTHALSQSFISVLKCSHDAWLC